MPKVHIAVPCITGISGFFRGRKFTLAANNKAFLLITNKLRA